VDAETFLQLAANLPPNHDLQPPPPPRLLGHPAHSTASRSVSFQFAATAAGTVVSCALFRSGAVVDAFHLCTGSATYLNLPEGSYSFRVRTTDAAGNTGRFRSYSFTVDRTAPRVSISGPPNLTTSHDATFAFKSNEPVTLTCSLDHAAAEPCSSPVTFSNLDPGRHALTVEATDRADNTASPTPYAWTIERSASAPIAFESNRDGNYEIYRASADGTALARLTTNAAVDSDPAWSPDGTRLAFESNRNGNFDIYVMNADGGAVQPLTTNPAEDSNPAWSPDGTHIAFESDRDGNHEIYVMNADGGDPVRLTTDPARDSDPTWSPDGARIAFASERDGNLEIYVMNADGSNPRRVTNNPGTDLVPDW
jgi:hypothetical protein